MERTADTTTTSAAAFDDAIVAVLAEFDRLQALDRSKLDDAQRLRLVMADACFSHNIGLVISGLRREQRRRRAIAAGAGANELSA